MPPTDTYRPQYRSINSAGLRAMTTDTKQLEGLGKLLKAAGVQPAGAQAMVRDHLDEIQDDARHYQDDARRYHVELIASVKTLEEELVELRHNYASSVSEIRMATDLMRREVEARSISFGRTLKLGKLVLIILMALQVIILVSLPTTIGTKMPDIGRFIPGLETSNEGQVPARASAPAPAPTSRPQVAPAK